MNIRLKGFFTAVLLAVLAGCVTHTGTYPASDAYYGSGDYKIPRELENGTATLTNTLDWSRSLLGNQLPLRTNYLDLLGDGKMELLVCQPSNAGTGGNSHLVFREQKRGFQFIGDLAFSSLMRVPADGLGRSRLITFWHDSAAECLATFQVFASGRFHELASRTLPSGDGPHAEGTDTLINMLADFETGKPKPVSEKTLELIFGDTSKVHEQ